MPKSAIKLILVFVSFFILSGIFLFNPSQSYAIQKDPFNNSDPIQADQDILNAKKINMDSGASKSVFGALSQDYMIMSSLQSFRRMLGGTMCTNTADCNLLTESEKSGAIGSVTAFMGKIYEQPPASFAWYTRDFMANAGFFAPPAYAQGIGFVGLAPLLPLWKAMRNISYAVIVVVMVAIGFMIIFRTKIDPKTVISIQAALPKIVVTLIIITFSYPIAGFMIDIMYLSISIVVQVMASSVSPDLIAQIGPLGGKFLTDAGQQQTEFMTGGWAKLIFSVFSVGMIPGFFQQFFGGSNVNTFLIGGGGNVLLSAILAKALGTFAAGATVSAFIVPILTLGVGVPVILMVVIFLGLLFTLIRLTFLLVNSYIQLLIAVILAPLLLLPEAIPGKSAFGEWIQNIIANLVVYPATVAVIYFSWIVTSVAWKSNLWGAPLTPTGGGGDITTGNPMATMLGLGIIFLAPSLVANIKKAFHPKPAIPITAGTAFSPVTGAVGTSMGAMQSFYYIQQSMHGLSNMLPLPGGHDNKKQ